MAPPSAASAICGPQLPGAGVALGRLPQGGVAVSAAAEVRKSAYSGRIAPGEE